VTGLDQSWLWDALVLQEPEKKGGQKTDKTRWEAGRIKRQDKKNGIERRRRRRRRRRRVE